MRNVSVAAREWKGEVVFLRKLTAGGASRSFGVEVAKLAGLPPPVVDRARAILRTLESDGGRAAPTCRGPSRPPRRSRAPQLGLFAARPPRPRRRRSGRCREVIGALRAIDPDELSPRAAHELVAELAKKLTHPS